MTQAVEPEVEIGNVCALRRHDNSYRVHERLDWEPVAGLENVVVNDQDLELHICKHCGCVYAAEVEQ